MLLEQFGEPYCWIDTDSVNGETRTPAFLAHNPNGRVPLLELADGRTLAESNAILWYLAGSTSPLSSDHRTRAQILQWMFFEQYSHEPYIAVARFICMALREYHARRSELPRLRERGAQALAVMEQDLRGREFFVDGGYSIADIALFAYTHAAADGGFDLSTFRPIRL